MIATLALQNEKLRIQDLTSYDILDTAPEKEFDELAELLVIITGCPVASICFIDTERQWFKAKIGFSIPELPRYITFCTHTILNDRLMMVEDATKDIRFAKNPGVTGEQNLRFYAGMPITSSARFNWAQFAFFDRQPGTLTTQQQKALAIVAEQVTKLLELRMYKKRIKEISIKQISLEKKTVQYSIENLEKERKEIGQPLHENFAKTLVACSLYLDMAEKKKEGALPGITISPEQ